MKKIVDPRIKQFSELVNRGIEAWTEAGRLLCEITENDPNAYTQILSAHPYLTRDVLDSFERIGRKQIYPYLLVDGSPGARRLAGLPYKAQVALYQSRVSVMCKARDGFEERFKRINELTSTEAALVFDVDHVRTKEEQLKIVRPPPVKPPAAGDGHHSTTKVEAVLDGDPKVELARLLTVANDAMVAAREALAILKPNTAKGSHITNALIEIGSLRYAVNEGEL